MPELVPITAVAATIHFGSRSAEPGETIHVPAEVAATFEDAGHGHRDPDKAAALLAKRKAAIEKQRADEFAAAKVLRDKAFADAAAAREAAAIERAKRVGAWAGVAPSPSAKPASAPA